MARSKETEARGSGDPGLADDTEGPTASQPYDLRIFQALRRIIRALDIHSRRLSSEHGITGPQLVCLQSITETGPLTQLALSERVHLSASTIVGILDRLESKGLVERKRDTEDRRRIYVTTTVKGREMVSSAPSPLQEALKEALGGLKELEQVTIALSLERIVELLNAGHLQVDPLLEVGPLAEAEES